MMCDSIRLPRLGWLLGLVVSLGHAPALWANEAAPDGVAAHPSLFKHMLVSNGVIFGPLMLFLALALLTLIVALAWRLRRRPENATPEGWASQERALRWLGGLGILSPLLGLLGTVLGLMLMFMSAGKGGEVSTGMLVIGLSHALPVFLEGLFLACIAITAYILFKNRLQRLTLAPRG